MEIFKRLSFSGNSETATISWRWLFNLCCSFSESSLSASHKEYEERRLLSVKGYSESHYQTINLEEAAEWITNCSQPISSIQPTEMDDDESLSVSDADGRSQLDHTDARTIPAEDVNRVGEDSKHDDDARSDISDEKIPKFGTVVVSFKFEMMRSLLIIVFHGVEHLPSKLVGGTSAYQLAVTIFGEGDKKVCRWNSTQFSSSSFTKDQTMDFPEMSSKDINKTAVRIRLYGCERKRRETLLGETVIGLENVDLKGKEQYRLRMEKKAELKHLDDQNMEHNISSKPEKVIQTVKVTPIKSFLNNKSDTSSMLSSTESNSSYIFVTRSNPNKKNPFIPMVDEENNFAKEMSKKATIRVEEPIGNQCEMLVGLGYNPITGRLTVEIVKGNSFKNPLSRTNEKLPNSFVKVTICAANNQEITRSKTQLRRSQANPLFKEKFMFQVPEFQLAEATLMFGVYHKKSAHRKEIIGWFSIGLNNSSEEEHNHWRSMLDSNGEEVFQWHLLQQNTKSRRGLPGAD